MTTRTALPRDLPQHYFKGETYYNDDDASRVVPRFPPNRSIMKSGPASLPNRSF
mgnify:CR=1 FL=1